MITITKTYVWTGINNDGALISGQYQHSKSDLLTELNHSNISLLSIKTRYSNINFSSKKISKSDLLTFFQQILLFYRTGTAINDILSSIKSSLEPKLKTIVSDLEKSLASGISLSQSFAAFPNTFDHFTVELIHIGETSGNLSHSLIEIIHQYKFQIMIKQKISKALLYPAIVSVIAIAIAAAMIVFVIPQFETAFESFGGQLPALTRGVISLSQLLTTHGPLFLLSLIILTLGIKILFKKFPRCREKCKLTISRLPIIKAYIKNTILMNWTFIMQTLLSANFPLDQALNISRKTIAWPSYQNQVSEIIRLIEQGKDFDVALKSLNFMDNRMIQLIKTGLNTGNLELVLKQMSDIYRESLERRLQKLSTLLEPLIMMLLAGGIGGLVIAMYLPIFQMGNV